VKRPNVFQHHTEAVINSGCETAVSPGDKTDILSKEVGDLLINMRLKILYFHPSSSFQVSQESDH
jgi:hypothetical protein